MVDGNQAETMHSFGETINYFGETFAAILIWIFLGIIPITVAMTNELTTLFTLVLLYH